MDNKSKSLEVALRITSLMENLGMKPADFAEKVGIQKSAVSHLTGARNNPSFEVIVRMLMAFPELNPDWLILGKGEMWRKVEVSPQSIKDNLPHQTPHFTSLKELANATPISSVSKQSPIQNSASIVEEKTHIINNTNVNHRHDSFIHREEAKDAAIQTTTGDIIGTPNSIPVKQADTPPDLVVLQPDGRYIRYRAMKE
jgi:bacteriophage CI repressor helix-turn-helix domain